MNRAARRHESHAQSLFPFLAVLLCAVGSLIVILVLAVYYAQTSARQQVVEAQLELQVVSDEVEFVSSEVEARRVRQQEALQTMRSSLAHYEDHISRLEAELNQLKQTLNSMEQTDPQQTLEEKKARIKALELELVESQKTLEQKVEELRKKPPAFAILPYGGSQGTTRRPIYLECTKEGVWVQPEGKLISLDDLRPPHGPGNPLDAILRLMGSEFEKAQLATSSLSTPYPLLLVRPDGIRTYALARNAMGGWDDQFGYELISAEMELAFPESLPGLASKMEQTLAVAKERQAALAAAMPPRSNRAVVEEEDFELEGMTPNNEWASQQSSARIANNAKNWKVVQEFQDVADQGEPVNGLWGDEANSSGQDPEGSSGNAASDSLGSGRRGQELGAYASNPNSQGPFNRSASHSESIRYQGANGNGGPYNGGSNGGTSFANGGGSNMPNGNSINGNNTNGTGSNGAGSNSTGANNNGAAGSANGNATNATGAGGGNGGASGGTAGPNLGMMSSNQGSGSGGSGSQSFWPQADPNSPIPAEATQDPIAMLNNQPSSPPGQSETQANANPATSPRSASGASVRRSTKPKEGTANESTRGYASGDKPISVSLGQGWAESRAAGKTTPVTRDIAVIIRADQWQIMDEGNLRSVEKSIALEAGPQAAGSELATAIRERVASWGIAVARGYWRPRLIIYPTPGAELSLQRFQRLMEGSGVEIQISTPAAGPRR